MNYRYRARRAYRKYSKKSVGPKTFRRWRHKVNSFGYSKYRIKKVKLRRLR